MKMSSGGNHYTQWILELHGLEYSKVQRNDCYQTLQGSEKKSACATGLDSGLLPAIQIALSMDTFWLIQFRA